MFVSYDRIENVTFNRETREAQRRLQSRENRRKRHLEG